VEQADRMRLIGDVHDADGDDAHGCPGVAVDQVASQLPTLADGIVRG
jgi:hypothetical protein